MQSTDVWLWQVPSGEPVLIIPDAADDCSVEALAFQPGGTLLAVAGIDYLATGGNDGQVSLWQPDDGDPPLEAPLVKALLALRARHASSAEARGTAAGKDTDGLLDLIADTPSSGRFRFRPAWPLELWWVAAVSSGLTVRWRDFAHAWTTKYPLAQQLSLGTLRLYGARGPWRRVGLPLVLPPGVAAGDLPGLLTALADAALGSPTAFANTTTLEPRFFTWFSVFRLHFYPGLRWVIRPGFGAQSTVEVPDS